MVGERRFKRLIEQVSDCEIFSEIGSRRFARTRTVVKIDVRFFDEWFFASPTRTVEIFLVHSEVGFGDGEFTFEQALVNGAELTDVQTAKVHGTPTLR